MNANMKIVGYTDSCTECECCGKKNLKGTFIMIDEETGEDYYYGSSCAFKKYGVSEKNLWKGVYEATKAKMQNMFDSFIAATRGKKGDDYWNAEKNWLIENGFYGVKFGPKSSQIITQWI